MDQSKSNNEKAENNSDSTKHIEMPKRSFSLEFFVGLFTLLGVATSGYLSVGLGGLQLFGSDAYNIIAVFDNISGLKNGASVEIAGVPVGSVTAINLNDSVAEVTLSINNSVKIKDDDIASIRTKGIIGDRYVKISRGASDIFVKPGTKMQETESVVDIEDIIGKIVHSFSGDKDKDEKDKDEKGKDKE